MRSSININSDFVQESWSNQKVRSSASEQSKFIKALQSCDLEKVLELLEKGNVDPFEVIAPTDELAKQLFSINEKKHFIPYLEEEQVKIEDFSRDCTMQAWMLISIFSDGALENDLKTQVFFKMKEIVGDDYDKKQQELSDEIKKKRRSIASTPLKETFNNSYQRQIEALAKIDKEALQKINKNEE